MKGSLSQERLARNGIRYDVELEGTQGSETHEKRVERISNHFLEFKAVQAGIVAEGLLDFDRILSPSSFKQLDRETQQLVLKQFEESVIPEPHGTWKNSNHGEEDYHRRHHIAIHEERFRLAEQISRDASAIKAGKEYRWKHLVNECLFGKIRQSSRWAEGLEKFTAQELVERIRAEEEDCWRAAGDARDRTQPEPVVKLTYPKPDLYLALPIVSRTPNPYGYFRDDCIQNFSVNNLANFEEKDGLVPNPIVRMEKIKNSEEKHLVCFPVAVIEMKHHKVTKGAQDKCIWQAANASSTALAMLAILSSLSTPTESFGDIRPVVSFTFIGFNASVWVSFVCSDITKNKRNRFRMSCIWTGDLRKTWETLQLCRIIENLQHWIIRHYRPWVTCCLDQWRTTQFDSESCVASSASSWVSSASPSDDDLPWRNTPCDGRDEKGRNQRRHSLATEMRQINLNTYSDYESSPSPKRRSSGRSQTLSNTTRTVKAYPSRFSTPTKKNTTYYKVKSTEETPTDEEDGNSECSGTATATKGKSDRARPRAPMPRTVVPDETQPASEPRQRINRRQHETHLPVPATDHRRARSIG